MKHWTLLLAAFLAFSAQASGLPEQTNAAQRLASLSANEELAASDARVKTTAATLDRVEKNTGEEPMAIAAACTRYARYLFDAAKIKASPLELLEALDRHARKGTPINETLQRYVAARQAAASRGHAEAMTAMARK